MSQLELTCKICDLIHEIETTQLNFFLKENHEDIFFKMMLNDEIKKIKKY